MALGYTEFLEKLQKKLPEEVDSVETVRLFPLGFSNAAPRDKSDWESVRVSIEVSGVDIDKSFDGKDLYEAYLKRKRGGHDQPFKGVIKGLRREIRIFREQEMLHNESNAIEAIEME